MVEKRRPPIASPHDSHDSHGSSVAAWTAVTIIAIGFLLVTIAWVRADVPFYIAGGIVIVVGAIAGKVLAAMGFGVSRSPGA